MAALLGGGKSAGLWEMLDNGSEATVSHEVIEMILERLRLTREMVTLVHKGYQSSKTVIVAHNSDSLTIDKPIDWPGTQNRIDILFRDETLVWNQMRVNVLRSTADSMITEFPKRLIRIQRRSNYRVEVPNGSSAMFIAGDHRLQGITILDISANGALFSSTGLLSFEVGDKLLDFHLLFPSIEGGPKERTILRIAKGRIARTARDNNYNYLYGVIFDLSREEEKSLLQFVRYRERAILRKGITD